MQLYWNNYLDCLNSIFSAFPQDNQTVKNHLSEKEEIYSSLEDAVAWVQICFTCQYCKSLNDIEYLMMKMQLPILLQMVLGFVFIQLKLVNWICFRRKMLFTMTNLQIFFGERRIISYLILFDLILCRFHLISSHSILFYLVFIIFHLIRSRFHLISSYSISFYLVFI